MLKAIRFKNFRVLRNTTLPLSRVTVIVGPNGSGKSTVLQALGTLSSHPDEKRAGKGNYEDLISVDRRQTGEAVEVKFIGEQSNEHNEFVLTWTKANRTRGSNRGNNEEWNEFTNRVRIFGLVPSDIAQAVQLVPNIQIGSTGKGLAGVLDNLQDVWHDRFQALNAELPKWLPEFDRVQFDVRGPGEKAFSLRRRKDGLPIRSIDLSEGSLFAVTLLTLAYLPNPPSLIGLEHPDAGIHPRLLRRVQDAIYRLAYPEQHGESRAPTQVIATTHSPYFLDLFKEHPEEIVIANKDDSGVQFQRLADRPRMGEILPEGPLGDLWYSGLLGGVPAEPVQP